MMVRRIVSDRCSIEAQIDEVEYELAQRRDVYPRLAAKHPSRASLYAMHEKRMRAVLGTLRWVKDHQVELRARKGVIKDDVDDQKARPEILRGDLQSEG
jgi:anti-sigma factor RsiW